MPITGRLTNDRERMDFRWRIVRRRPQEFEWLFKRRCLCLAKISGQVYDPLIAWTTCDIVAILIWLQHLPISATIRIGGQLQPRACSLTRNVERTTLLYTEQTASAIFGQRQRLREVHACC